MFSFHRPKVYRSSTGCCICKAKSSSSRFTDSKKYEEDFLECFKLSEPRQGEICNACVLLVKRWKKLPAGTDRNWRHVVDARAGPGMKSMTKFKSKNKKLCEQNENKLKMKNKKTFDREDSPALSDKSETNEDMEIVDDNFMSDGGPSGSSSRTASPRDSDNEEKPVNRRHKLQPKRREDVPEVSEFLSDDYWIREQICCGTIFRGQSGEVAVDLRFLKPCNARIAQQCKLKLNGNKDEIKTDLVIETNVTVTKVFSDSSSDSGYDESSNQGLFKSKEQVDSIEEIKSQMPQAN